MLPAAAGAAVRGKRQRSRPRRAASAAAEAARSSGNALVIGAGPGGLSAAILLAKRGWDVTVLERVADPTAYVAGRAFMYLVDGRGQRCLEMLGGLLEDVQRSSVESNEATLGILSAKGLREFELPLKDKTRKSYWIPRHVLVGHLLRRAKAEPRVKLLMGVDELTLSHGEDGFVASAEGVERVKAELLVGADGLRSQVREKLEDWDGNKGRFVLKSKDSPAAGLRYKVLTLPNGFSVQTRDGPKTLKSDALYSVRGEAQDGSKLRLGLLPVSPEHPIRTANLITKPDDPVWQITDEASFKEYAKKQWPHFPLADFVSSDELRRFAADPGGRFPRPQCSPCAAWVPSAKGSTPVGAILLGDALHAFPPDLGQGVNSALQDVMSLQQALASGNESPAVAAQSYAQERALQAEALVDLVSYAAPFQYGQDPMRSQLWNFTFLFRTILAKLMPSLFDPMAFMLIQQTELSYSDIVKRSKRGARRARALLALLGAGAIFLSRRFFL